MMTLADLPQVQALSTREKLQLVDDLWIDVAHDMDALEITSEERRLLDDRWDRFLNNPSSALNIEELKKRVHALRA